MIRRIQPVVDALLRVVIAGVDTRTGQPVVVEKGRAYQKSAIIFVADDKHLIVDADDEQT